MVELFLYNIAAYCLVPAGILSDQIVQYAKYNVNVEAEQLENQFRFKVAKRIGLGRGQPVQ